MYIATGSPPTLNPKFGEKNSQYIRELTVVELGRIVDTVKLYPARAQISNTWP